MNKIRIALIVIVCFLIIFLYYRFKSYSKSLYVVNNDDVTNKTPNTFYFKYDYSLITPNDQITPIPQNVTNIISPRNTINGGNQNVILIGIYNNSMTNTLIIKGVSVYFQENTTIESKYRIFNTPNTEHNYNSTEIKLYGGYEIIFKTSDKKIDRIILFLDLDSSDVQNLIFYTKDTNNKYRAVSFDSITYSYLTIDIV